MHPVIRISVAMATLGVLAGCSLFGVATKGDLKKQNEALESRLSAQAATWDSQLAGVSGRLDAMDHELGAAIADLEDKSHANSVAVADVRTRFEAIQGQLQMALADLESVSAAAERAEVGSRQALQAQREILEAERARLQGRLRELDGQLARLPSDLPVVPGQELRPGLTPEEPLQDATAQSGSTPEKLPRPGLRIPDSVRK